MCHIYFFHLANHGDVTNSTFRGVYICTIVQPTPWLVSSAIRYGIDIDAYLVAGTCLVVLHFNDAVTCR